MGDKTMGLYYKFDVIRTDERDKIGQKHYGCEYFVLDLTHDPHALSALRAYRESCKDEYPVLAFDLLEKISQIEAAR